MFSRFLLKAMDIKFNNYHINKVEFNTIYNTENIILINFFDIMVYLAFKFDCVLISIKVYKFRNENLKRIVIKTIKTYTSAVMKILIKNKGMLRNVLD